MPIAAPPDEATEHPRSARPWLMTGIAMAAIIFDGYDLIVFGSIVPDLLKYQAWHLTPATVGVLGSYALMGMLVGALLAGPAADRFGRKAVFVVSLSGYSLFVFLSAFSPTPTVLGILRFLAGIGFGAIAPVVVTLVMEAAPRKHRNLMSTIVLCGLPIGGIVAALIALTLKPVLGFRGLLGMGGIALVTVVPLAIAFLPESRTKAVRERTSFAQMARDIARTPGAVVVFGVLMFTGFLLTFGLNTWLPGIMTKAGYDLSSALAFQLLLNIGAVIGGLIWTRVANRTHLKTATWMALALAAVSISALALKAPAIALYPLVFLAGAGALGAQMMTFAYSATWFPDAVRGTAVAFTSAMGRLGAIFGPIIGGIIVGAGLGPVWSFGMFAAAAAVAAIACLLLPRPAVEMAETVEETVAGVAGIDAEDQAPTTGATA